MKPFATAIALAAALFLGACEEKISQENFDRVQVGMELGEVEKILGKGELLDQGGTSIGAGGIMSGSSSSSQKIYQWTVPGKEISITFDKDGKVFSKTPRGL